MTDEQINQAIATHLGITRGVPNFTGDLNEMHELEEQMDEIDWVFFMTELAGLVRLPKQAEVQIKQLVHSTARHRAQALLKTLGKWEEVQE